MQHPFLLFLLLVGVLLGVIIGFLASRVFSLYSTSDQKSPSDCVQTNNGDSGGQSDDCLGNWKEITKNEWVFDARVLFTEPKNTGSRSKHSMRTKRNLNTPKSAKYVKLAKHGKSPGARESGKPKAGNKIR